MNTPNRTRNSFEDIEVNVKLKLAALWTSLMFLVVYVDYFHLYMSGTIEDIQAGIVFEFNITSGFLISALALVTVPALMIFVSVMLPAKTNRRTNIIIASVNIPFMLFNLVGEVWIHMVFGAVLEVAILCLIIRYAWKWPRIAS